MHNEGIALQTDAGIIQCQRWDKEGQTNSVKIEISKFCVTFL
jgi:hypothetical protein